MLRFCKNVRETEQNAGSVTAVANLGGAPERGEDGCERGTDRSERCSFRMGRPELPLRCLGLSNGWSSGHFCV